jgi:aromatic ring-opening dioxygenase LigB subunit
MITSAFITPHSPVLIPAIGKANTELLQKTTLAYQKILDKLLADPVDTVLIISPHNPKTPDAFAINSAPEFVIKFESFGDFATKTKLLGDVTLAHELKENLKNSANLQLTTNKVLDYGSAIPLWLLSPALKNTKIIAISQADLSLEDHFAFGKLLQNELITRDKKIAIIASGDLSHRLKRSAPGGYSPKGAKFDNKVIEYLNEAPTASENILNLDKKLIADAMECGLKSIVMLLGILDRLSFAPQVLAYQTDFGVGYLTMDMNLTTNPNVRP